MTSLDMAGFSISIMKVDETILKRLDAPTRAPSWPVGADEEGDNCRPSSSCSSQTSLHPIINHSAVMAHQARTSVSHRIELVKDQIDKLVQKRAAARMKIRELAQDADEHRKAGLQEDYNYQRSECSSSSAARVLKFQLQNRRARGYKPGLLDVDHKGQSLIVDSMTKEISDLREQLSSLNAELAEIPRVTAPTTSYLDAVKRRFQC